MIFTEYQIEYVLYPAYMRLDRDRTMFIAYAKLLFPTAPPDHIEVIYDIFAKRNPPVIPPASQTENVVIMIIGLLAGFILWLWFT